MARITLLTLPAEIRLHIYELLLVNRDNKVMSVRTEEPAIFEERKSLKRRRTTYRIMSGRFRACSIETTYHLIAESGIYPSILGVNRQIYREASHVLYSSHVFDFGKNVESVIPFFRDLTPTARSSVKRVNIVQRALPYIKEFDRCEWRAVCKYISENLELTQLGLGILGGVPGAQWAPQDLYEKTAFEHITKFEGMEWVKQVATIKGLRNLEVKAHMEHCPPPQSNSMAFFVNFSASIEKGFADYLRELMVIRS
ncbi:hypothetical protein MMC30_001956 [Trapelia coarctata]|nr:hypothetical protein [Trapelia coarctata]